MPNPKRRCIFYREGCTRCTKEDVWPTWLTRHIPRDRKNYTSQITVIHDDHTENYTKTIAGDPKSRRVKYVCASCNNGWMSSLQNAAKPHLLPLILGEQILLTPESQKFISSWATMSVMTSDFYNPDHPSIPQSHRDYFRSTLKPPEGTWKIWIGAYKRANWIGHWVKHSLAITSEENIAQIGPDGIPRPNTQMTTLVVGELYIHAISSTFDDLIAKPWFAKHDKLIQIWPAQNAFVGWPPPAMTDTDADHFAGVILETLSAAAEKWAGR